MSIDIDALRAPWSFTLAGRTYTAQRVSVEQVAAFGEVLALPDPDPATQPGAAKLLAVRKRVALVRLLRHAYPWKLSYGWRRSSDPVRLLLGLDLASQKAVLEDFFAYAGRPSPESTPPTSTPSPNSPRMSAPV